MSRNFYDSTNNTLTPIAGCLTVDNSLSAISENPVQNKVVKAALDGKAATSDVPTKVSDLTNDSGFITSSSVPTKTSDITNDSGFITTAVNDLVNYYLKSETYSKTEVDSIASAIKNSRFEVVSTLPSSDIETNVIYLVPSADPETSNIKDEYINLDGTTSGWELIGSTSIDLSGYVTTSALNTALADYTTTTALTALLNAKQDTVQFSTVPTASADYIGRVVQYVGTTNANYTNGYFYKCVEDSDSYSWDAIPVQADDYSDLTNKPSIENVTLSGNKSASDLGLVKSSDLATVATSGSYNDLDNKPTITRVKGDSESEYRTGDVNITAANIGLGDVGNFKAVSTEASQGLTDTEKANARNNIGALDDSIFPISEGWASKTWNGYSFINGDQIWTDGDDIYYSFAEDQYVLNMDTSTWSPKTWNGLTNYIGQMIWTDGDDIYYSFSNEQYVLNKSTSTWLPKTWTYEGLEQSFAVSGLSIWTDGVDIYFSSGKTFLVLDKSTSTWHSKTWSGLTIFYGQSIWTDGDNIYYSNNNQHYVLDVATSTWSPKTWNGTSSFIGQNVWTDGDDIYYSLNGDTYILDKSTSTWSPKTWDDALEIESGGYIWNDGTSTYYSRYYSDNSNQYVLNKVKVLGTAAIKDVAISGDASATQVVMGNDSRLTDSRPASDVSSWAKESTKPTYTASEVGLGNVGNFKAVSTEANQELSTTEQANARTNIGAGTSNFDGAYSSLSGIPTLGTASSKDVATTGDASVTEVVMGNDSRLTDSRPASDVSSWAKAATKPSYTASEVGAVATSSVGTANGIAELDANGKVLSSQLPSYVDDVIEGYYDTLSGKFYEEDTYTTEIIGESGKIYVDLLTDQTYRWSGSVFTVIGTSLALGETSSTAYRGDRGKTAYDHSQTTSGNPHNVTASDVGLGNVGNYKSVSTEASQGLTSTEQANARANIGAGTSSFDGAYSSLSGTPTLGTAAAKDSTNAVTENSTDLVESGAVYDALGDKADSANLATVATTGSYSDLSGVPTLATVATSGSYNDLDDKPTIPGDLDDLSDVTLSSPTNGQVLKYNSTTQKFENANESAVADVYTVTDSASTTINDTDYVPMSESGGTKKKALWTTVVEKIKAALGIASSGDTYLKKDGTWGTPANTTYTFATGDNDGQIKVTPSGGTAQNVSVKSLQSAAYLVANVDPNANTVVKRDGSGGIKAYTSTFTGNVTIDRGGTDTAENWTRVWIGNNKASGTAGNQTGWVSLYASNGNYINVGPSPASVNQATIRFPASTGTLATTAQLTDGSVTKVGTSTVGHTTKPIYLNNGIPTAGIPYVPSGGGNYATASGSCAIGIYTNESGNYARVKLGKDDGTNHGQVRFYSYGGSGYYYNLQCPDNITGDLIGYLPKTSGQITVNSLSSRRVKKNIHDMTEEEAKKLLNVDIVKFDYRESWNGGIKNQSGVIAEDVINIIPEVVEIDDNYDPNQPVDMEYNLPPIVDYRKFIPYMIKMIQMQQEEIEELKTKINN